MTKKQAAEKVAKLRRLAERAGTPAEADTARRNADKIVSDYGLTTDELTVGIKAAAFDDLIDHLHSFVKSKQDEVPAAVFEVIERFKKEAPEADKASMLIKLVAGIRMASFFFGQDKTVKKIKATIEDTLKSHGVTI